jgi:hypothetical protein
VVLRQVGQNEVDDLPVREHVRDLIREAFSLAAVVGPGLRIGHNAHNFGYRGHCLTKSRRYSTTFKALRAAREEHRETERQTRLSAEGSQPSEAASTREERFGAFEFRGVVPLTASERDFALRERVRVRERPKQGSGTVHTGSRMARGRRDDERRRSVVPA